MRRGFPYETSITCKKEGKIYVESRILRPVTMSWDTAYTEFAWDQKGAYIGNTGYGISTTKRYLCALLNSHLIEYLYARLSPQLRGGFYRFIAQYMEQLPIVEPTLADQTRLATLVDQLQALGGQGLEAEKLEREVDAISYRTYDLSEEEIAEIERWHAERRAQLSAVRRRQRIIANEEIEA